MGLFNSLFSGNNESNDAMKINWKPLTESNQFNVAFSQSKEKPFLIFKHSTRCGISRMALKSFEKAYQSNAFEIDLYFLDLLNYRALSNEISEKSVVSHQSPQVLVFKDEHVVYHDSHYSIDVNSIEKIIKG
ncbi:MAG: bacillithiol system redox-active protein YtxJ [Lutibacter sp.]|uniref:bacillithiol system redox-active protein YtxJ n=1 Tax=Lutibacter sp. TaxID=1925666 RepID=UPI0019EA01BB|nr:bacillithiol system redox-active protein YtxJ [Lutibacter sp.]NOR29119.1 bacillithiol system redox-active protein YtxJ [Lutibacter sp.]